MKKIIILVLCLIFVLAAWKPVDEPSDVQSGAILNNTEGNESQTDATVLYNQFLNGESYAYDKYGDTITIDDCLRDPHTYEKYAFYDMNKDSVPELIIKSSEGLTILWITNKQLSVWYDGTIYEKPLNNRVILYERPGGAPEHTDYQYIVLDYTGEELLKISFSEYYGGNDPSLSEHFGSNELYLINEQQVSKTVYENLCKIPILGIADDAIKWQDILHT